MGRNNKFTLVVFLVLLFSSTRVNCNKILLNLLSAGDVVNDINLDQLTSELMSNLFNDETAGKYVQNISVDFMRTQSYTNFFHCNNTFDAGYYPDIRVEASKKIDFDDSKLTASVLGIDDRYIGDYFCVSFKECLVKNEQSISTYWNNATDLPEDVKRWMEQIRISQIRRENETSYVSVILTGDCVYQILVYEKPEPTLVFDYSKKTPIFEGRVSAASHNETLENWTNDFLKNSGQSLANINYKDKKKIFEQFNNRAIIQLRLNLLPEISRES